MIENPDLNMDIDTPAVKEHIVFKLVVPEKKYQFIHPLKQRSFRNLMRNLPQSVEQLWVFGSAVTRNHYPWSDIDILCIGEISYAELAGMKNSLDCESDILIKTKDEFRKYQNVFGHCFYHVLRDGIKYYDRSWLNV